MRLRWRNSRRKSMFRHFITKCNAFVTAVTYPTLFFTFVLCGSLLDLSMENLVKIQAFKVCTFYIFVRIIFHSSLMSESKLLKTNRTYTLGRKEQPLVIASKKISKDHCDIVVGDYTVDDVVRWLSTFHKLFIIVSCSGELIR